MRGEPCIDRATAESSLEALLRRTEALQLSSMEADRARLIAVAERLVQLGAAVGSRDAEGRTALHLAAGCGDKAMVLKLVALGTDINCRDSVGGAPLHPVSAASMFWGFSPPLPPTCKLALSALSDWVVHAAHVLCRLAFVKCHASRLHWPGAKVHQQM